MGCIAPTPPKTWRLYVPPLVLHTVLYLFTAYRGLKVRSVTAEHAPLMERLMRECVIIFYTLTNIFGLIKVNVNSGGVLYLVVLRGCFKTSFLHTLIDFFVSICRVLRGWFGDDKDTIGSFHIVDFMPISSSTKLLLGQYSGSIFKVSEI